MPDIVVLGDINVDILMPVDVYPPRGGHGLARTLRMASGGSAANTAVVLRRFRWRVAMLGRVGDDPLAGAALRALQLAGVDLSKIQRDREMATGLFFIVLTPDGERTMFGGRGANGRLSPEDVDAEGIRAARWLHISGYALLEPQGRAAVRRAIDVAQAANVPVSLDMALVGVADHRDVVLPLLPSIDLLLASGPEAEGLTGEADPERAARALHAGGARHVALKLGDRGCHVVAPDEEVHVPAFAVDAVDSTGAGDAFNAGWITGHLGGLTLRQTALLANALGGLKTTIFGVGEALPGPGQVLEFMAAHQHDPRWAGWRGEFKAVQALLRELIE